ncbi:MAG: SLBB domain-containing protein [Burkholderiaceae bacterium]
MTDLRFRPASLLLAFCVALAPIPTLAVDDPMTGTNTFDTPGYSGSTSQRSGTQSGTAPPSANAATPALRSNQDPSVLSTSPDQVRRLGDRINVLERRASRTPTQPSDFQTFVEAATGRLLPIFGSRFFADAADSFSAVENAPVSADYTIGAGDEIVLRAWGSIDVDYRSIVDRNGMLNLPKIGSFGVAGVKAADLEKHLRAQIGRLYTNFNLSVSLGQLRGLKVFIVGPAQRPGVFTLASQSTLLSAVVTAGGPSPTGSMRMVQLRRDGRVISELDIYDFLVNGEKSKDLQLAAGDVVVFQPVGSRVALTGALDTPAIYELKTAQEPVREVLRYAGGMPLLANPNRAQLERIDASRAHAARFVEEFKLDDTGLQKSLRDGDVLTLLPISPQFANAVTLRGHVAQPLRYPFTPGMRVRDLIPDREALIKPDFYRRKNLLVQVIEDDDAGRRDTRATRRLDTPGALSTGGADRQRSGNGASGNENTDRRSGATGDPSTSDRNLPAVDSEGRARSDRTRNSEDVDRIDAARKSPTALFEALNWDYAVIERLNKHDLSTQVIPFNLGRVVLQGDETDNLELMAGDVVTIYGQKDIRVPVSRQTRLVSIEGEVASPGVYQLQPGDTLKSMIVRAGGITPQAYLYGLEFSREETRQRQRENLTAAIARLESLSAVQAARDAANRRDDAVGAASTAAVSNSATQAQLQRLRAIEPTGRIALELQPETSTLVELPDVPLDGGDRVIVPSRPGFVTVAGAVVNSNAFLWRAGRTAGEYLRIAGVDEAADPSNTFILRADGTVSHAGEKRGFFSRSGIDSQILQPGDAVIVPSQLDFETWGRAFVRNLKDFAQIFSGFGIGIAAVRTL